MCQWYSLLLIGQYINISRWEETMKQCETVLLALTELIEWYFFWKEQGH